MPVLFSWPTITLPNMRIPLPVLRQCREGKETLKQAPVFLFSSSLETLSCVLAKLAHDGQSACDKFWDLIKFDVWFYEHSSQALTDWLCQNYRSFYLKIPHRFWILILFSVNIWLSDMSAVIKLLLWASITWRCNQRSLNNVRGNTFRHFNFIGIPITQLELSQLYNRQFWHIFYGSWENLLMLQKL